MADEKEELAEMSQLDEKVPSRSSKDLWLFLIIVDVICLCVFGFFLYKNLSAKLLAPQSPLQVAQAVEETVVVEDASGEVVEVVQAAEVVVPEPAPVVLPQQIEPEPVKPVAEPVVEKVVAEVTPEKPAAKEKKESVTVQANPKSKYRQVTFRYFDDAKDVSVVSGFTMAKPRALTKKNGVWETTLAIAPGTYKYLFVVNGKQQLDPYAPEKDGRSVLIVE